MSLKIVVLAKQVPDTRNVGPDAMTPEGTVNRAALPAVFRPRIRYTISAMAKEIGVNEYRFKKAWQAAKGVSRERIKRILIHLYNTDRDIKTGRIERNTAIELFAATV